MRTAHFGSTAPKAAKVNTLLFSINPFYQQGLKRLGTAGRLQTTWDEGVGGASGDTRLRAGALPGGRGGRAPTGTAGSLRCRANRGSVDARHIVELSLVNTDHGQCCVRAK